MKQANYTFNPYLNYESVIDYSRYCVIYEDGSLSLECPDCFSRITSLHKFVNCVGLRGFDFCPYCGSDLRPGSDSGQFIFGGF